jgi:hypothetical protein
MEFAKWTEKHVMDAACASIAVMPTRFPWFKKATASWSRLRRMMIPGGYCEPHQGMNSTLQLL